MSRNARRRNSLSLAAGACYAVYALSAKQLLLDGWTPTGSVALIFGWSAVGALPFLVLSDLSWLATLDGIVMALWLGIVTITVACLFLANGLKALRASTSRIRSRSVSASRSRRRCSV